LPLASLWEHVVGKAGRFVAPGGIDLFRARSPGGRCLLQTASDRTIGNSISTNSINLDLITTGHYFADVGQPIAVVDLMLTMSFLDTRFLQRGPTAGLADSRSGAQINQ
jgi:hypothetical protein